VKADKREKIQHYIILCIFILALMIRIIYIWKTPYNVRQHDGGTIDGNIGHIGYIKYFLNGGMPWLSFDPRTYFQFYHPPLHHIIAALYIKVVMFLGGDLTQGFEALQFLIVFYSMVTLFFFYRILQICEISDTALDIVLAIIAFQPSMIILSGSINNDELCLMFMTSVIYFTLKWYDQPEMKNILKVCFCLIGSILSKESGLLLVPGITVVFAVSFFKNIKLFKKYIIQFMAFLALSIPLGLSWVGYTYFKFGMPINYVYQMDPANDQYVGYCTFLHRILGFHGEAARVLFETFDGPHVDYNILLAILKSSSFGEYTLVAQGTFLYGVCFAMLIVNAIVISWSVYSMIKCVWFWKKMNVMHMIFLVIVYFTIIGMYLKFCMKYPYTCSMDCRYTMVTILIGAVTIGKGLACNKRRAGAILGGGLSGLFCITSVLMFVLL